MGMASSSISRQSTDTNRGTVTIPYNMQLVFNAYLAERNFHLFTMACAEYSHQMRLNTKTYFEQWTSYFLTPLRLRAPLLHPSFLKFLFDCPVAIERRSILERYLERWNQMVLPILEEHFLQYVRECYDDIEDLFAAIEDSFSKDSENKSRYERLTRVRLLRLSDEESVEKMFSHQDETHEFHKNIVQNTLLISSGFAFRTNWTSNLWSNWKLIDDSPLAF